MSETLEREKLVVNEFLKSDYFRQKGLQLDLNASALSKIIARFDLYRMVEDLPGDIVECGVYRGAALFQWANYIEIFSPVSQREVIGFDTFTGFPNDSKNDNDMIAIESIKDNVHPRSVGELTSIAEQLKVSSRIKLVAGDANHTIPEYVNKHPSLRVALLHIDFDTYAPTMTALENLFDLVTIGGVLVLDQYADRDWGETQAVDEFFEKRQLEKNFKRISWSSAPRAFYVKEC